MGRMRLPSPAAQKRARWVTAFLSAALVVALLPTTSVASPIPTTLSLTANPPAIVVDGSSMLTGSLKTITGTPIGDAVLKVFSSYDALNWSDIGEIRTQADGTFSFEARPSNLRPKSYYRLSYPGGGAHAPSSATVEVVVRALIGTPSVPVIASVNRAFTVSGTLKPWHTPDNTGTTVRCYRYEKKKDGTYGYVYKKSFRATASTLGEISKYSARVSIPSSGKWKLRAKHEDSSHSATWSDYSMIVVARSKPDAAIWNRDRVTTIPEKMYHRADARQLFVATGSKLGARYGTLRLFEYRSGDWVEVLSVPCRFGSRGLTDGATRTAGSRTTPTGIWVMPSYAFGKASTPPSGTKIAYRKITTKSWWSGVRNSTYNTWVTSSTRIAGIRLYDYRSSIYRYAVPTGFNAPPNRRRYSRGAGVFLHVHGSGFTKGSVSISATNMVRVIRVLNPKVKRAFSIGTTKVGSSTSIYAY